MYVYWILHSFCLILLAGLYTDTVRAEGSLRFLSVIRSTSAAHPTDVSRVSALFWDGDSAEVLRVAATCRRKPPVGIHALVGCQHGRVIWYLSFMIFHYLSSSCIIFHYLPLSFIIFHYLSWSFVIFHCLSLSFIIIFLSDTYLMWSDPISWYLMCNPLNQVESRWMLWTSWNAAPDIFPYMAPWSNSEWPQQNHKMRNICMVLHGTAITTKVHGTKP